MTAHEASSSSSSKSKLWNYDVFLSFRGEDTRKGFTDHLRAALKDRGYQTFMGDNDLKRGKEMKEERLLAIEESRNSNWTSVKKKMTGNVDMKEKGLSSGERLLKNLQVCPATKLKSMIMVSLLPLKEAAATSILSRRWRHVWASTTTLSFDAVNFDVGDSTIATTIQRFLKLEKQARDQESHLYVNWVDHILGQHRGQCIERFRVCFFLQRNFAGSIAKWIQFAMEKRVQILELELWTDSIACLDDDYTFPHKLLLDPEKQKGLFSNLPSLRPCGYSIAPFKSLRVVRFKHVGVIGDAVEFLLSNCPVLERLSLSFAKDLGKLRVIGPSIALKYLEIKYCLDLRFIEISGANIVSFIYCGPIRDLSLNNVPLLVEVYNQNHAFPAFSNLKHLELLVDADYCLSLGRLASFMKAAPDLRSLVLGLGFRTSDEDMAVLEEVSKQPHHCLKLVEMAGYRGHKCCVKHVRYLVKNAVALKKIVINPVRFWGWPRGFDSNALLENEEENARDHAIQHLKKKVPSSVEFVCL
ncbi:unnamed protein product [Malus baccata var. baccata]